MLTSGMVPLLHVTTHAPPLNRVPAGHERHCEAAPPEQEEQEGWQAAQSDAARGQDVLEKESVLHTPHIPQVRSEVGVGAVTCTKGAGHEGLIKTQADVAAEK